LPDDEVLEQCLKDMLELPEQPKIYLIVDALDECPSTSRDRVLDVIENLIESSLPNLRIFTTSRPETEIRDALEPLASQTISLHEEDGQKQDMVNHITSFVNLDRKMRKWSAKDKKLVIDTLSERADGMYVHYYCISTPFSFDFRFRWVSCQLEVLRGRIPGTIDHALKELPRTLDETYERILRSIDDDNQEYALCLFQCLCVSIRPLRVAELADVLAILFDTEHDADNHIDWRSEDAASVVIDLFQSDYCLQCRWFASRSICAFYSQGVSDV